jgi:hypothetical protein
MNLFFTRPGLSLLLCTLTSAITPGLASALETPPGEAQTSFESANGVTEFCSLPRILDPQATLIGSAPKYAPFTKVEIQSTKRICGADFYDTRESTGEATATVVCPKLGSTNPAVMLHTLPFGTTRAEYVAQECPKVKGRAGDLIAKYKQSVSCSYTPSILTYPRLARIFRSEIELPFTAYRSMDRREHLEIADRAKDLAARVAGRDALIAQTWRMIYRDDLDPASSPRRSVLYRDADALLFGALVPDTPGDEIYWAANGSTNGDRVANFQMTKAFRMVSEPTPVSNWRIPTTHDAATLQKVILLREMGDLIVLDSLLNQQDRFGNLHTRPHYVRMNSDGAIEWKLLKTKKTQVNGRPVKAPDPEQAATMTAQGFVAIDRMLLADNDCGVAKENRMRKAGIPQKVTHLHPDTYLAVQRLHKLAGQGRLQGYLKSDLLFLDKDVTSVQANIAALAVMFKKKCLAGRLFLDADIAQHLGAKPKVDSVAFCQAN